MGGLGIQHASLLLLILTTILSLQSRIFQVKTSIRESIEQLDHIVIYSGTKLKPVLRKFRYLPILSVILRKSSIWSTIYGETEVEVIHYANARYEDVGSEPHINKFSWLNKDDYPVNLDVIETALENIDGVHSIKRSNKGYIITIHSRDAVQIRDITQSVMEVIWNSRQSERRLELSSR
jgi:hypothetical protein